MMNVLETLRLLIIVNLGLALIAVAMAGVALYYTINPQSSYIYINDEAIPSIELEYDELQDSMQ